MRQIISLDYNPKRSLEFTRKLIEAIDKKSWVEILPKIQSSKEIIPSHLLPEGPGIIIKTGGSTGGSNACLHPCRNFDLSALATAQWLLKYGLRPSDCVVFNPLPMNHVSGLMPWWRCRNWGAKHISIDPELMKSPIELEDISKDIFTNEKYKFLTSIVPTQLQRLLKHPSGENWLKKFDLIWVGGANLSTTLANLSRDKGIRLSPCYGTTETAAMITAQSPDEFLEGQINSGKPLDDVELRLGERNVLEIRSPRLAISSWRNGLLTKLTNEEGWWQSGDVAQFADRHKELINLKIIGRIDRAIHSGGETIFPEQLKLKLTESAEKAKLPITSVNFIPVASEEWGERLVGIIQFDQTEDSASILAILNELQKIVRTWLPAERPFAWYKCQEMSTNSLDKLEVDKWKRWLDSNEPIL